MPGWVPPLAGPLFGVDMKIGIDMCEFEKTIAKDPSFINMGKKLKLRGSNHAFLYKGKKYKAYFFPNFGSTHLKYWEVENF